MASVITTTRPHNTHIVISTSDDDEDRLSPPPHLRSMSSSLSSKFPHTNSYLSQLVSLYAPTTTASFSDDDLSPSKEPRLTASLLLPKVIGLLRQDNEEELKEVFKDRLEIPDDLIESTILEIMHRHLNDQQHVPFTAALASTPKRPSRPSSRASTHSFRLDSNSPASSPRAISFIHASTARRPHTPVTSSPLHINATGATTTTTTTTVVSISPASSPPILHASIASLARTSPTSSPLSSPRFLNAKEFRPRPSSDMHPLTRTLSAEHGVPLPLTRSLSVSSDQGRGTPSPDLWAHNPTAPTLTRTSSNLAIAAPLVIPSRSPTPSANVASMSFGSRPNSRLGAPSRPPFEDDDDDEFSPFGKRINIQPSAAATATNSNKTTSEEGSSAGADGPPGLVALGGAGSTEDEPEPYAYPYPEHLLGGMEDQAPYLGGNGDLMDGRDGMTPFDVLQSVFGNTLAPGELEDALGRNGWDFEGTMQYLVDRQQQQQRGQEQRGDGALPTPPPSQGQHLSSGYNAPYAAGPGRGGPAPGNYGHKVIVVPREQIGFMRGGRPGPGFPSGPMPRQQQIGGSGVRGGRVCRYFLAGECRRADCRFSHDLDRALCRFWLRGICAKGDQCEFMHRLPNGIQLEGGAVPGAPGFRDGPPGYGYLQPGEGYGGGPNSSFASRSASPALGVSRGEMDDEEFPALGSTRPTQPQQHQPPFTVDPSKNRFARQVVETQLQTPPLTSTHNPNGRPSPRIIFRPPMQLPLATLASLPTTENTSSKTYQTYRERPTQLSAARNACLARAADAWRRGDVQLAKRFTREGHELNAKMRSEGRDGGRKAVLEWAQGFREEFDAVAASDHRKASSPISDTVGWETGEVVANGLGVCLGQAPGGDLEVYIDLRGLFVDEGVELLEEYLMILERDGFAGLAYAALGEDPITNDAPPNRLSRAAKDWLGRWAYPWTEVDISAASLGAGGLLCIDPLTHVQ